MPWGGACARLRAWWACRRRRPWNMCAGRKRRGAGGVGRPDGYGYSRFCDLYRDWRGRTSPVMRQIHQAGDKLFVDYAGMTLDIYLPDGEVRAAHLFVAGMGASQAHSCGLEAQAKPGEGSMQNSA